MRPSFTMPPMYPPITVGRFAATIRSDAPDGCRVALIGVPDDTGVRLNNGRPGAAGGPRAFREALTRFGVAEPMVPMTEYPCVFDAGDVEPGRDIHETHERVTKTAEWVIERGLFPIAVGGGHDVTFAFVRAACAKLDVMSGVYYDAHLDVRAEVGSGMPFRALIERCGVTGGGVTCVGAEPMVNSREHAAWLMSKGGVIVPASAVACSSVPRFASPAFVSLDMDCFNAAFAPGVSAINVGGLSPAFVAERLALHGSDERVACFDIMELNPAFDSDGRTARLAAFMFLTFLQGFARRGTGGTA